MAKGDGEKTDAQLSLINDIRPIVCIPRGTDIAFTQSGSNFADTNLIIGSFRIDDGRSTNQKDGTHKTGEEQQTHKNRAAADSNGGEGGGCNSISYIVSRRECVGLCGPLVMT